MADEYLKKRRGLPRVSAGRRISPSPSWPAHGSALRADRLLCLGPSARGLDLWPSTPHRTMKEVVDARASPRKTTASGLRDL